MRPRVLQNRTQGPLARLIAFEPRRSSIPACPDGPPAMSMSQRMGTIYPGAPGATGRQACARSLAEHATSNRTEEANDRCRTPDDGTAEYEHSDHNRTTPATRQAPAWAPFTFQGLSCELRHAAHGRFVKARPARPVSAPVGHANRDQTVQSSRRRKRTRDRAGASRGMIGGTMANTTKCAAPEGNRGRDERMTVLEIQEYMGGQAGARRTTSSGRERSTRTGSEESSWCRGRQWTPTSIRGAAGIDGGDRPESRPRPGTRGSLETKGARGRP